ncbi:MAG TPA: hypothetical protein ACFYD9_03860 [Candidatus Wunengus sp. YC64]
MLIFIPSQNESESVERVVYLPPLADFLVGSGLQPEPAKIMRVDWVEV